MLDPRRVLQTELHRAVGFDDGAIDLTRPAGDPGLFGPTSVSWRVHGDFTAMMIGGLAALLLQMLHPAALAGVWDHSRWREDRMGRLRRTAQFIAATTYGPTAEAERLIALVRAIHDRVHGTLPDGTAYDANDPALLTWVHAAEARCFLSAYLRYVDPALSPADQDLYYAEAAVVAERLGARDIPRDAAAIERYFRAIRPALRADARSRAVAHALLTPENERPLLTPAGTVLRQAAVELLPRWAADLHGLTLSHAARPAVRFGAHGVARLFRWALTEGSAATARRRVATG